MLVVPSEQRRSLYELLGLRIRTRATPSHRDSLACVLSTETWEPSFHLGLCRPSLRLVLRRGIAYPSDLQALGPSAREFMDAHLRGHAERGMRTLFAAVYSNDCLLVDSPDRAVA